MTKLICDTCGGERDVKPFRYQITASGRLFNTLDGTLTIHTGGKREWGDLCSICQQKLISSAMASVFEVVATPTMYGHVDRSDGR